MRGAFEKPSRPTSCVSARRASCIPKDHDDRSWKHKPLSHAYTGASILLSHPSTLFLLFTSHRNAPDASPTTMSSLLTALPAPLFARIILYLFGRLERPELSPQRDACEDLGTRQLNLPATLECFSTLNKALHALVRQTEELYLRHSYAWCRETNRAFHIIHASRLALICGYSSLTNNSRIEALLASSFANMAGRLALIDLRASSITSISIITIF